MWLGLVFVACLATGAPAPVATAATIQTAPAHCRNVEPAFDGSLMQCMLFGQQGIVGWRAQNEQWVLRGGYACKPGRPA